MVSKCENYTQDGDYSQITSLWIVTFIQDVIAGIGIIGNISICAILMQKSVRNTFNQLRVALALFDIIMLIAMFTTNVLFRSFVDILQAVYPVFLWPLKSFSMTISVFMTVAIAWERYGAINDPYTYKSYQEYRSMKYVSSLTVIALILNSGKFLELQPPQCIERPGFTGVFELAPTFKNRIYALYNVVFLRILITGIIPMTLLLYLYTKIFFKIREHNLNMAARELEAREHGLCENKRVKKKMMQEQRMAVTFAGVVVASLICTIPGCLIVVQPLINGGEAKNLEYYEILIIVRDVFLTLNSAINIFIYTCLDKTFRRVLRKFFRRLLRKPANYSVDRVDVALEMEQSAERAAKASAAFLAQISMSGDSSTLSTL